MRTTILGLKITQRAEKSTEVQDVLTKFGCSIHTRLGLHEASEDYCSQEGLIILELVGDVGEMLKLEEALKQIPGVEVQKMVFD